MNETNDCIAPSLQARIAELERELAYQKSRHTARFIVDVTNALAALVAEVEAIMRGEHGSDWADNFGPLFENVEVAKRLLK
jgi:hypothetical protein